MENASKALVIAGAVLVAILLIAFGMIMINSARTPIDEAAGQGEQQAIEIFNAQFASFAGNQVSGPSVRSLYSKILTSNAKTSHKITVTSGTTNVTNTIANTMASVINTKTYKVVFGYDANGYINKATITQN